MKNFENMINSNSIPSDVKDALGKVGENNNSFDFSKISPEMINTFANMLGKNNVPNSNNTETTGPNIDADMLMKMKTVMEKMNSSNDPRSNLLSSLKPYLKGGKKGRVEQYMNLFNMAKVMDIFNNNGGAKK